MRFLFAFLIVMLSLSAVLGGEKPGTELVLGGNFESATLPQTWKPFGKAELKKENGRSFLHCSSRSSGATTDIQLLPDVKQVKLTLHMKTDNVTAGSNNWQDARLAMSFHDGNGKRIGPWPDVFHMKGTTPWQQLSRVYNVPAGAVVLRLTAGNFGIGGSVSFDDISVKPILKQNSTSQTTSIPTDGNLAVGGDFEGKKPTAQWRTFGNTKIVEEAGKRVLLCGGPGSGATTNIPLQPGIKKIKLSMQMKADGVVQGKQGWQDARLAVSFHDSNGKQVGGWPHVFHKQGTTSWQNYSHIYTVPLKATTLRLTAANFGSAGTVSFDNISVTVAKAISMDQTDLPKPAGFSNVWDMQTTWQQQSATQGKICLNDLWQFRPILPVERVTDPSLLKAWGWGKVPHIWPNAKHWTLGPSAMKNYVPEYVDAQMNWDEMDQAWYKRSFTVPAGWQGRSIGLEFTMIQTQATVYIDHKKVGECWFPGGIVDITKAVTPGKKQTLTIHVTARPVAKERNVFMAPDRIMKSKATVLLKGITGDLYLVSSPKSEKLGDSHLQTSVRNKRITCDSKLQLADHKKYQMSVDIFDGKTNVKSFQSQPFSKDDLNNNRYSFTAPWQNPKLWDLHTPENIYRAVVTLKTDQGQLIDQSLPISFGFREFWIDGRDFFLNGSRIHLRALHVHNPGDRADKSSFEGCLSTCERLKEQGFNSLIWANYSFNPGQVGYLDGLVKASDQTGVLNAFSLPHAKDFSWKLTDPEQRKRYQELTEWMIRRIQNNPSVVLYAMSHNACGYYGDQNPQKIDGKYTPKETRNRKQALIAEEVAASIDSTRPIYHHQSGNLGQLHTINIYLDWSPVQERNDWLKHWAENGTKPVFFVEWGLPHIASWSSYRGPRFIWGVKAFQSIWDSEFAAPFIGQSAYEMTAKKKALLNREEYLYGRKKPFSFGSLFSPPGFNKNDLTYLDIQALYANQNWRAHRTWGASAMLPWDQGGFFLPQKALSASANKSAKSSLQQPGIVPDTIHPGKQFIYHRKPEDFKPTSIGKAMLRWNQPVIAYLGGSKQQFSASAHNYTAGDTVEKQFILVNDARTVKTAEVKWSLKGTALNGKASISASPGDIVFKPLTFTLPADIKPGHYQLQATFTFKDNTIQQDSLQLDLIASTESNKPSSRIVLFDPANKSAAFLKKMNIPFVNYSENNNLTSNDLLIIGRDAVQLDNTIPAIKPDMRVLILEQQALVLQKRLGFRIQEHGMRKVYVRSPNHPVLKGISDSMLHNWHGSATLVSPYLQGLPYHEISDPKWYWCGFHNTRVWRCGNVGNIASVVIEKPSVGPWKSLLDCGFDLQYTPLLEYDGDNSRIVFCQLDLSQRTQADPAANKLFTQLIAYMDKPLVLKKQQVMTLGNKAEATVKSLGFSSVPFNDKSSNDTILVISTGSHKINTAKQWLSKGGSVLALALNPAEVKNLTSGNVTATEKKVWPRLITNFSHPALTAISNADVRWRTYLKFAALNNQGNDCNEALQVLDNGKLILCQTAPWMFDVKAKPYLRISQRRNNYLVGQLLRNLGATSHSPLLERLNHPAASTQVDLAKQWHGKVDRDNKGRDAGWFKPDFNHTNWETLNVPGNFDEQSKEIDRTYQGLYWYRQTFTIPENFNKEKLKLYLGRIDDESWVWLNGHFLGEITRKTNPQDFYCFKRSYNLKPEWLNYGAKNTITILVNDTYMTGGIHGKPYLRSGTATWLDSYYVQQPIADDDPYRYYRW